MTIYIILAIVALGALLIAYSCGHANGEAQGVERMKRDAIRAGVAKACDFEGGWRWWTRTELENQYARFSDHQ